MMISIKGRLSILLFAMLCVLYSCSEKAVVEKYDSGKAKLVAVMKKKDGVKVKVGEERLYENGKTRHKGKVVSDKRTGIWKFYFENGKLFSKADFTNSPIGENWSVYDTAGTEIVNGKDKVLEVHFASDGGLCDIKVKRGSGEVFYKFFESFKPCIISNMKGNIPNGETTSWFENGKLNSFYYYKDGIQDSSYKVYTETGGLLLSGQYKMGVKVGKWEYFLSDGTPAGIEIYDVDGTLLKGRN